MINKLVSELKNIRLELLVFLSGAMGMILEMVGSRVVSPYFGNSLVVWTSLIGVVLGCLSAGYYFGGKWADKNPSFDSLGKILFIGAISLGISALFKEPILSLIQFQFGSDIMSGSLISVLVLFGPVSVIFGMIAPFAAKIRLESQEGAGKAVGALYALSTFGSISGTFLAGFYLIPTFGNTALLYGLSLGVLTLSFMTRFKISTSEYLVSLLIIVSLLFSKNTGIFSLDVLEDVDSQYNRILVKEIVDPNQDRLLGISTDNAGIQSAYFPDKPDELFFSYVKAYRVYEEINPDTNRALMIGGGGFSFPRYFLNRRHSNLMDVVEIDPVMTVLAKKYFRLEDSPRMKIFHQDARIFLNESLTVYDLIFLDAFNSLTPPPHLTTKEFMFQIKNHLTENGFVLINLVSSVKGNNSIFFNAEVDTLQEVFPYVEVYKTDDLDDDLVQNLLIVAYKASVSRKLSLGSPVVRHGGDKKILTDDWSPVEFMTRRYY